MSSESHAPAVLPSGRRRATHFIGGWVGLGAGLDVCRKPCRHHNSIPGRPARSETLYLLLQNDY